MQIHISRGGQKIGGYSLDEANRLLNEGFLRLDDQAWTPGQGEWKALSAISGIVCPNIPPPIPQMTKPATSPAGYALKTIAVKQKMVFYLILSMILGSFLLAADDFLAAFGAFVMLVLSITAVVFVYQLATALRLGFAGLWAFASVLPCAGLLVMFVVTNKATKVLKENGITIGLMGVSSKQIQEMK